jgi:hypothetical protein
VIRNKKIKSLEEIRAKNTPIVERMFLNKAITPPVLALFYTLKTDQILV